MFNSQDRSTAVAAIAKWSSVELEIAITSVTIKKKRTEESPNQSDYTLPWLSVCVFDTPVKMVNIPVNHDGSDCRWRVELRYKRSRRPFQQTEAA